MRQVFFLTLPSSLITGMYGRIFLTTSVIPVEVDGSSRSTLSTYDLVFSLILEAYLMLGILHTLIVLKQACCTTRQI